MQLRCLTCLLLIFLLSAGYPHHAAYSTPADNSALSKPDATAIPVALTFLQALSYSPENNTTLDSVVIPLKRAGRLLLVEAVVDNETGNLVFDTGANGLVFNSTYFRNHLKSGGPNSNGITGAIGAVEQITIDKIEFAGLTYKKIRADMTNLGHIENRRGVKILGLFGFNMIRNFEIQLDTKRNQLRLYRIDKSGNRVKSETSETKQSYSQSIKSNTNILILQGKIGGKILNFCLDTGAETNVISSYSNKNILNTLTIMRRSGLHGAGASGSEVLFARMNDFTLGSEKITGMETIISNLDALSEAYGTKIDGMLGFNFIEQGIVRINFVKRQFSIQLTKGDQK